jgi:hypothetical protein
MNNSMIRFIALSGICLTSLAVIGQGARSDSTTAKPRAIPNRPVGTAPGPDQPGQVTYLDHLDGFKGDKFGSPRASFKDLVLIRDTGRVKVYSRGSGSDNFLLAGARVDKLRYYFLDDLFYAVVVHVSGPDDTESLLQLAETAFGPGKHVQNSSPHELHTIQDFWTGRIASATYSQVGPDGELWIGNNALQAKYNAARHEALTAAAAEL